MSKEYLPIMDEDGNGDFEKPQPVPTPLKYYWVNDETVGERFLAPSETAAVKAASRWADECSYSEGHGPDEPFAVEFELWRCGPSNHIDDTPDEAPIWKKTIQYNEPED